MKLTVVRGNDTLVGENDNQDTVGGDDTLNGDAGDDLILGGMGNDIISGGIGNDLIQGDVGDDTIYIEGDNDNIYGGLGSDRFIFVPNDKSTGFSIDGNGLVASNIIWDFDLSDVNEKIDISAIDQLISIDDLRLQNFNINGSLFTFVYLGEISNQYIALYNVHPSQISANNFVFYQDDEPVVNPDSNGISLVSVDNSSLEDLFINETVLNEALESLKKYETSEGGRI